MTPVTTSPSWDPGQYERFAAERARAFHDLVARVPVESARRVVDLGCGPGTLTATLLDRWPDATVVGIDSSPAMLARAATLGHPGRLDFEAGDAAGWSAAAGTVDVIIANAVLQWLPDHVRLLPGWAAALRRPGALAFQVPAPGRADPALPDPGEIFRQVAHSSGWRARLARVADQPGPRSASPVRPIREYLEALTPLGFTVDAWETTYHHVLPGQDAVLEWSAGTGLRPYLDALQGDDEALSAFRAEIAERLRGAYPQQPFGTVLPFRRIFVVASRPAAG